MSARHESRPLPEEQLHFAHVLGEAIGRRGLTLDQLTTRLRQAGTPVSMATLSYWQTGRSLPTRARSLRAVDELERVLRVPVGHLSSALPTDTVTRWEGIGQAAPVDQGNLVLQQMGLDTTRRFTTSWVQDCVVVDAGWGRQVEATRQLLQPTVDGLDRIPLVFRQTSMEDEPPAIEAVTGCELGRVVQLDEHALVAAELLLPHPLALGEDAAVEYRVTWNVAQETEHGFARLLTSPVSFHVLDVTFEGTPPHSVDYFTSPKASNGINEDARLRQPVTAGPHVQVVLADPQPGVHGLDWTGPATPSAAA